VTAGVRWTARQGLPRWIGASALVAFSAALVLGGPWLDAYRQWNTFAHYLRGEDVVAYSGRFNHAPSDFSYRATREIAVELKRRARPGERLLVWGAEPGLYRYSGLPPATRFLTHAPILTADDPVPLQQEVLDEFSIRQPEWIVVRHGDQHLPFFHGRRDSREALKDVPPLHDTIAAQYTVVEDRFGFAIHQFTHQGARVPERPGPPPIPLPTQP